MINFLWVILVLAVAAIKDAVSVQRCYVCIPNTGLSILDVQKMFPNAPTPPLCSQFQIGRKQFIRECPAEFDKGCATHYNGTHVTKQCAELATSSCQMANDINYCYCEGDLCNAEPVNDEEVQTPPSSDSEESHRTRPDSDDEDSSEGSGSFKSHFENFSPQPSIPTVTDEITVEDTTETTQLSQNATGKSGTSQTTSISGLLIAFLAFYLCL